jgi:hypothetical protein
MAVAEVTVSPDGGPVSLRVADQHRTHALVSVVWRFAAHEVPEGVVGEISRELPQVPLGSPGSVDGKGFLVDGFVVPAPNQAPAPYQVVVTVLQGGREVHQTVPLDRGSGTLGPHEIRFRYPFVLRVRPSGCTAGCPRGGRLEARRLVSSDFKEM